MPMTKNCRWKTASMAVYCKYYYGTPLQAKIQRVRYQKVRKLSHFNANQVTCPDNIDFPAARNGEALQVAR